MSQQINEQVVLPLQWNYSTSPFYKPLSDFLPHLVYSTWYCWCFSSLFPHSLEIVSLFPPSSLFHISFKSLIIQPDTFFLLPHLKFVLTASFLSHLSLYSPFSLKMLKYIVYALHFHPLTLYYLYCPISQLNLSTLCTFCIMAQDESHSIPYLLLVVPQIVLDRHGMAANARGPFVGQWVEQMHALRCTQIEGYNTERKTQPVNCLPLRSTAGVRQVYTLHDASHTNSIKPFQGQWRGFMGCTVSAELESCCCCQWRNMQE